MISPTKQTVGSFCFNLVSEANRQRAIEAALHDNVCTQLEAATIIRLRGQDGEWQGDANALLLLRQFAAEVRAEAARDVAATIQLNPAPTKPAEGIATGSGDLNARVGAFDEDALEDAIHLAARAVWRRAETMRYPIGERWLQDQDAYEEDIRGAFAVLRRAT